MIKTVVWWMVYFVAWIGVEKASGVKIPPLPLPFCTSQGGYVKKG